ncbi:MAG: amidohydrolase family protein [Lentisphaerae bacterium]|nr:amidohydrolase family protein [Lentisphaerota bacterium]MCP4103131.1 amidohydrolase family protein [Lentisphaerota bacterium]
MVSGTLVIRQGRVVDAFGMDCVCDVEISNGLVSNIGESIPQNGKEINAAGKFVIPGLVDTHVHVAGSARGYYMLARAGVTTALDMMGETDAFFKGFESAPTGLNVAYLYPLIPERTVSSAAPSAQEITQVIEKALQGGAIGIKIVGGHYPLTPEATALCIEICAAKKCWCAVHAGTTENGSNLDGLKELVDFAGSNPVHIAHVNSYCRGDVLGDPVAEAVEAIKLIKDVDNYVAESYLADINGCSGRLNEKGEPVSNVTRRCLEKGGFRANAQGMKNAIEAGWAKVHGLSGKEIVLLSPEKGVKYFQKSRGKIMLSFPVNSAAAQIAIALAKTENTEYIVQALSTDGGNIPRNCTLEKGLSLVKFGAFSIHDFIRKACWNPAVMLGLQGRKGAVKVGFDADIAIVDPVAFKAQTVLSRGIIVFDSGEFYESKNSLIISKEHTNFNKYNALCVSPSWLR